MYTRNDIIHSTAYTVREHKRKASPIRLHGFERHLLLPRLDIQGHVALIEHFIAYAARFPVHPVIESIASGTGIQNVIYNLLPSYILYFCWNTGAATPRVNKIFIVYLNVILPCLES